MADAYRSPDGTWERIRKSVLEDYSLTGDEARLLNYAAAKPAGWVFYETAVVQETGWTAYSVRKAFTGLHKHGYLIRKPVRDDQGKAVKWNTTLNHAKVIVSDKEAAGQDHNDGFRDCGSELGEHDVSAGCSHNDGYPPGGISTTSEDTPSSEDTSTASEDSTPNPENTANAGPAKARRAVDDDFTDQVADELAEELAADDEETRIINGMVYSAHPLVIRNTINKHRRGNP